MHTKDYGLLKEVYDLKNQEMKDVTIPKHYWMMYKKETVQTWDSYFTSLKMIKLHIKKTSIKRGRNCLTIDLLKDEYTARSCKQKFASVCEYNIPDESLEEFDYSFRLDNVTTWSDADQKCQFIEYVDETEKFEI